ncbi:hypothetical protein [Agromyces sp. Marseille-P2726]|uniref:hypothetical protein n=1 Tax=Agromyces sp. Marseille-P2726 TaxID=2709132 RepID=UPI00156EEFC6|nr:hypothetical protein [Agromyces sp. Marseille-P2726]
MDAKARDERMRELQRVAYGAVASDAERAAAIAELESLRQEQAGEEEAAIVEVPIEAARTVVEKTPTGSTRAMAEWIAASDAASVRRFRWAMAAGTAALLVGVAVGWQLGARFPPPSAATTALSAVDAPAAEGQTMAEFLASQPVAAETRAADVFSRPATSEDVPVEGSIADFGKGPLEFRLLGVQSDGTRLYAARDSIDLCLYVSYGAHGAAAACTQDGRFPRDGLTLTSSDSGSAGEVDATWHVDGSLELRGLAG